MTLPPSARSTAILATAVFAVLALAVIEPSKAQSPAMQRCVKADDIRLIEILFASDSGRLPCKVIYRPESANDKLGIVSWQNIPTLAACRTQADEVVERLTVEGWTCTEGQAQDDQIQADQIQADQIQDEETGDVAALVNQGSEPETERDESDGAPDTGLGSANLRAGSSRPDSDELVEDEGVPAKFLDNPDIRPPSEKLVSLIKDDLSQLDTTLDGILEARIADYGDVNADDTDDALVLYTFTSAQPAYRQFLAVYVFDGDSYQLTATRPVSGNISATMNARVEMIDRGVVHLVLEAYEPGDEACCPSGTERMALALRELDLVEIDADAPTR